MYLSQLVLNTSNRQARKDLSSHYEIHASLCRGFVKEDEVPPRFLWRLEEPKIGQSNVLLVQSEVKPDWYKLDQRFEGYFRNTQVKILPLEQLQIDQILRFRLKANPTVTKKDSNNLTNRKRYGLKEVKEQLEWLSRQGQKKGFTVLDAIISRSELLKIYKHNKSSPITLQAALYDGHIRVTNLKLFKEAISKGIGKAKALGFGLLSIAKG